MHCLKGVIMFELLNDIKSFAVERTDISFGVLGVLATIILYFLGKNVAKGLFNKETKEKAPPKEYSPPGYYKFIWKDAKELTPEDILGLRGMKQYGFKKYYYRRNFHKELVKRIKGGKNTIVVGMSLSGKTRTVYEALKSLGAGYSVTLLEGIELEKPDLTVPLLPSGRDAKKRILVIDDINNFIGKPNFDILLKNFMAEGVIVVATCRTGPDLVGYTGTELSTYFQKPIEIAKLKMEDVKEIVKRIKVQPPDGFDWNIGSLFLPLSLMKVRYNELNREEKRVLKAINRLHFGGVFIIKGVFPLDRVKRYYEEKNKVKIGESEFTNLLEDLKEKEFLEFGGNIVKVEEAYLDEVIEGEKPSPEDFAEMIQIFINDPQALFDLGFRASDIGKYDIRIRDYMKVSIVANLGALKYWTEDNKRYKYAMTKNNLGLSYCNLSRIEDTLSNLNKSIKSYKEILNVFVYEEFPVDYAMTQNNLGNAYCGLAIIKNTADNLKRAIGAYDEALKVRTLEEFPTDYATTQNNLGGAYWILSKIEEMEKNLNRAIKVYKKALKVRTLEEFPIDYATTQNNLGVAYKDLAKIKDTAENLKKAIRAYEKALNVYTIDEFPIDYAMTQNNLGNVYGDLAKIENTTENIRRSIGSFGEALKVRTIEKFPIYYAQTQNNLGIAYKNLAKSEDTTKNLKKSIGAYREALKVRTLEEFPIDYAQTQNNLGNVYGDLAKIENTTENTKKAIRALNKALDVYTINEFPMYYAGTQNNLGVCYNKLAKVEETSKNLKKAIKAYEEALKVKTVDKFPIDYAITKLNLGNLYSDLVEMGEKEEIYKKARDAYEEALEIFKKVGITQYIEAAENNIEILNKICNEEGE